MNEFITAADRTGLAGKADVVQRLKNLIKSRDPRVMAAVKASNDALLHCKGVGGTIHVDSVLTNMSVQYKNEDYIGLQLMPVVTSDKPSAKYFKYSKRDRLSAPDDSVENRSTPNEVTENRTVANFSTSPFALLDFLSESDLRKQDAPLDEMVDMLAAVNEALAFREEKRIAAILTTAANYSGNTATLAGTSQWSDFSGTSDPIADIMTARDACWSGMGATKLVGFTGLAVYNKLRRHPKIIAEFKHTSGLKAVTRQQLAEYFELDELLVAKAWEDTANEGQAAAYSRIWGKDFGVIRVAQSPGIRTAAFGYTFRFGEKKTTEWYDPKPGVGGGFYGKVGMEECHNIVAADTGYLIKAAIA